MNINYFLVLAYILLSVGLDKSFSQDLEERTGECLLGSIEDNEISEEVRRRFFGGPYQVEDAVSILNMLLDLLTEGKKETRERRFQNEARTMIEILTDDDEFQVLDSAAEDNDSDPDFEEESMEIGSGRVVRASTMQKILNLHDGLNGESKRTAKGINTN